MPLDAATNRIAADTAVVTLTGSFTLGKDLENADTQIHGLIADGVLKLVLDLSALTYMDSAGLATIVHVYGQLKERGGMLRICGVQDRAAAMLKMTRTNLFLPIDADPTTSLVALGSS